jgi:hypothetical protein
MQFSVAFNFASPASRIAYHLALFLSSSLSFYPCSDLERVIYIGLFIENACVWLCPGYLAFL